MGKKMIRGVLSLGKIFQVLFMYKRLCDMYSGG